MHNGFAWARNENYLGRNDVGALFQYILIPEILKSLCRRGGRVVHSLLLLLER